MGNCVFTNRHVFCCVSEKTHTEIKSPMDRIYIENGTVITKVEFGYCVREKKVNYYDSIKKISVLYGVMLYTSANKKYELNLILNSEYCLNVEAGNQFFERTIQQGKEIWEMMKITTKIDEFLRLN